MLIFFAYLVGGYAAGRMARFAGAKQGIAVWLWQIMALILGSLATFLMPQLFQNSVASLSLQKLIAGDFANGLLAVLLVLALSSSALSSAAYWDACTTAAWTSIRTIRWHARTPNLGF